MGCGIDVGGGHGKNSPWLPHPNASVCSTHTDFLVSLPTLKCMASSVIRWHESFRLSAAQKNSLQGMRASAYELVRLHHPPSARSVVGQYPDSPRIRGSAHSLPLQRQGETRASGLPGRHALGAKPARPRLGFSRHPAPAGHRPQDSSADSRQRRGRQPRVRAARRAAGPRIGARGLEQVRRAGGGLVPGADGALVCGCRDSRAGHQAARPHRGHLSQPRKVAHRN